MKSSNKKDLDKMIKGKERHLILEVGNYNTKMIEVVPEARKINIEKGFIFATPTGTIEDDVLVNYDELVEELMARMKEEKITTKQLTVSLSSMDIITREMSVPMMSKKDVINFIKNNAPDIFPVDLSDYTLAYTTIEAKHGNSKLLIAAIPNDIIEPYIKIAEKLNLSLKSLSFSGFGLYNLFNLEMGYHGGTYAVIDLGSKNTNFIIVSRGMLMYNRVLKTGSDDITKMIADKFKCTLTKAEKIKRDYNSVITEGSLKKTDDVYVVAEIIQDVLRGMLTDVGNIIEYYNGGHARATVSKVYIIGLATKISGISEFVEATLGIETEKIKEFERVIFEDAAKPAKRRQVTIENCLGAVPVDDKKVNLIKGKLQLSKVYQSINPIVYQIGVLIGVLMILALCVINFSTYKIKEEIAEFDSYIAGKKNITDLQAEYAEKSSEIDNMESLIRGVPSGKEKAYLALQYVNECVSMVPGISLTNCTVSSEKKIRITFAPTGTDRAFIFDEELRNYFSFDDTFYNSSKKEFSLELELKDNI